MLDMLKTKQTFIITVICPYQRCQNEMTLKSNSFVQENEISVKCDKCKRLFIAKNNFGGYGGV
jgi:hypothetical protein